MPRSGGAGALQLVEVKNPARVVVAAFAVVVVIVGTVLLSLPIASESGQRTELVPALFTAVSAVCVTGLIVLDTPVHFSSFGEVVIMVLIQIGGLGVMTLATLIGLAVGRRIGMRLQASAQTETKSLGMGEVRGVVARIVLISLAIETVTWLLLSVGFLRRPEVGGIAEALYVAAFHAVSAFNNAGFSLFSDSLMQFVGDPLICVPIMIAVILGGIGFPVLVEIGRRLRRQKRRFGLHAGITLGTTAILLVVGSVGIGIAEWSNPATLGGLRFDDRVLASIFHGVMPRTAGFNSLDVEQFRSTTLFFTDILMFIGGGSAGTAGGVKVTTFALLAFVVLAEARGEPTVHVRGRRLPVSVQRQAITVVLVAVGVVIVSALAVMSISEKDLDLVLFEVISAFGTVGLSAGITAELPTGAQLILIGLMFLGRLGPITLASALALRQQARRYELPKARPLVG